MYGNKRIHAALVFVGFFGDMIACTLEDPAAPCDRPEGSSGWTATTGRHRPSCRS
jgi:hypothetical protein